MIVEPINLMPPTHKKIEPSFPRLAPPWLRRNIRLCKGR